MTTAISMTIQQAAEATGLGQRTIQKRIDEKKLPAKKDGTRTLIRVVDLEAYIDSLENARD